MNRFSKIIIVALFAFGITLAGCQGSCGKGKACCGKCSGDKTCTAVK